MDRYVRIWIGLLRYSNSHGLRIQSKRQLQGFSVSRCDRGSRLLYLMPRDETLELHLGPGRRIIGAVLSCQLSGRDVEWGWCPG